MSKKKHAHEEHVDETWLIPYADVLTLLLALFIVLFATAPKIDQMKVAEMGESFNAAFHGSDSFITENFGGFENKKVREQVTEDEEKMMKAVSENSDLREVKKKIDEKVKELGLEDKVNTSLNEAGLRITLTDEVLFESGSANMKKDYIGLVDAITTLITTVPNPVQISGHTDNVPISTSMFPSNWELSSARSTSVLRYMLNKNHLIDPSRMSATGYGEYLPIASNESDEGRDRNRRVEILIKRMNVEGLLKTGTEGGAKHE